MKILITLFTVVAIFGGAYAFVPTDSIPTRTRHEALFSEHTEIVDEDSEPRIDEAQVKMAAYIEGVMRSWSPARIPMVDLSVLAQDIASVTLKDEHAWKSDSSGARTAVLLAALAYFEGARFAQYVDDGLCNDRSWRRSVEGQKKMRIWGDCDGGYAHSLFQIHTIRFPDGEEATPEKLLDRRFAIHIALKLARRSLQATNTLKYYTGEWAGAHVKADVRLNFAEKSWRAAPF